MFYDYGAYAANKAAVVLNISRAIPRGPQPYGTGMVCTYEVSSGYNVRLIRYKQKSIVEPHDQNS